MSARFRSPAALAAVCVFGTLTLGAAGCASKGVVGGGAPSSALSLPGTSGPTGSAHAPSTSGSSASSALGQPADSAASPNSSGSAPSSGGTGDPSALASSLKKLNDLWTDPGCKIGLRGFGAYMTASLDSPAKGNDAIPGAIRDLRAGATTSKRPDATLAMNNMAKDLQTMSDAFKAGQTPDRGKLRNDWTIMGNACTG